MFKAIISVLIYIVLVVIACLTCVMLLLLALLGNEVSQKPYRKTKRNFMYHNHKRSFNHDLPYKKPLSNFIFD